MRRDPDVRMREEFGGVKKALEYCVSMNMNKTQAAEFLQIDRGTLRERAKRLCVEFPCGYATRDMTLTKEVNRERISMLNSQRLMGRAKRCRLNCQN